MITILMAVYNGEKYLAAQIESILAQTEKGWKLVIQDDCSTDGTAGIALGYANKHPDKIIFIQREHPSGSAKSNFFSMIRFSDTEYTMLSDQDDVWLPDKIEISLKKIAEIEKKTGSDTPILVHTDLKVADRNLNILSDSLFRYHNYNKNNDSFNNLLVQNIVTGSTMIINRALIKKVPKEPENAIMHDWWFALTAAAFGCIGFLDEPTVLYRQHSNNEVGAKKVNSISYVLRKTISVINSPAYAKNAIQATYEQAKNFYSIFQNELTEEKLNILTAYMSIPSLNKFSRIGALCRNNFFRTGLFRKIGQILLC